MDSTIEHLLKTRRQSRRRDQREEMLTESWGNLKTVPDLDQKLNPVSLLVPPSHRLIFPLLIGSSLPSQSLQERVCENGGLEQSDATHSSTSAVSPFFF